MLKKVAGKKLGRSRTALLALMRSQARSLVAYGFITTTESKAKLVQRFIEKLAAKASNADISSRRGILAELGNDNVTARKLFTQTAKLTRKSGFTRIVKFPARSGDNAKMARIEWVDKISEPKVKEKGSKKEVKTIKEAKKE